MLIDISAECKLISMGLCRRSMLQLYYERIQTAELRVNMLTDNIKMDFKGMSLMNMRTEYNLINVQS